MIKLQLALDLVDLDTALSLVKRIKGSVDIVEIGTPLLMREGVNAVKRIRDAAPDVEVLADTKIVDGGYFEATLAFEAGADYVTVLALAARETIEAVNEAAAEKGGSVVADLIGADDPAGRLPLLLTTGIGIVCLHRPADTGSWAEGDSLRFSIPGDRLGACRLMAAGGINLENLSMVLRLRPDIVVVGGFVTNAENPVQVVHSLREAL